MRRFLIELYREGGRAGEGINALGDYLVDKPKRQGKNAPRQAGIK
jgi:hypothetical protein